MPSKLRIGEGIFGVGSVLWTTGSLASRGGFPVKRGGSSGRALGCAVPWDRPRLRTEGEMAFLYECPTVIPCACDPFAFSSFVELTGVPEPVACVVGPERLFPAMAIEARNSAANSIPLSVFLLGARITATPFRVSGRFRFVLAPSILLWPSTGTVVLLRTISRDADGRRSRSCRTREVGRARSRTGEEQAGAEGSNLDHGFSRPPPNVSSRGRATCPTPDRSIVRDGEPGDNGPRGSFSAQRGTRSPGRKGLGPQCVRVSRDESRAPPHECRGLVPALHAELLEEIVDVVLHGRHLDAKAFRDLLVRQPVVDQLEDLPLACRERR